MEFASKKIHLNKKFWYSILASFIFFITATITLPDYNIMWDGRTRFLRGQALANYFLFQREDYSGLPITKERARYVRDYAGRDYNYLDSQLILSPNPLYRRSIYQDDRSSFRSYKNDENPLSHPPLSDIGAAISNILFYEKLGILSDYHAYAFYSIVLSSTLVGVLFYWLYSYGLSAAVVGTLALSTTPFFWAQSHYNIKDIPEMVYFALAIWAFYMGVNRVKKKWILISGLFAGAALGTKFNALFLPVILVPWFIIIYLSNQKEKRKHLLRLLPSIFLFPILMFSVYIITWPLTWDHPLGRFLQSIDYYKEIGTNIDYTPSFRTKFGFNTYALEWIVLTTYPLVIALAAFGTIMYFVKKKRFQDPIPSLAILWFAIAILRVSLPNTSIYGGIRQIAGYIPAFTLMAGYGTSELIQHIPNKWRILTTIFILLLFSPLIITLIRIHPAESAYFNSFIKGLSGAREKNITGWGNTDGGIYSIAVRWLNKNAIQGSHIAVGYSETADFYIPDLREDLIADNRFSGQLMEGEYIVAPTHDSELEHTYRMKYSETYLEPIFVWHVDGVPLIKIWKNDILHRKQKHATSFEKVKTIVGTQKDNTIEWDLNRETEVVRIDIAFQEDNLCLPLKEGYIAIAGEDKNFSILPEVYPNTWIEPLGLQPKDGIFTALLVGEHTRYIKLMLSPNETCLSKATNANITTLESK